jgi:hypothetical protein
MSNLLQIRFILASNQPPPGDVHAQGIDLKMLNHSAHGEDEPTVAGPLSMVVKSATMLFVVLSVT